MPKSGLAFVNFKLLDSRGRTASNTRGSRDLGMSDDTLVRHNPGMSWILLELAKCPGILNLNVNYNVCNVLLFYCVLVSFSFLHISARFLCLPASSRLTETEDYAIH